MATHRPEIDYVLEQLTKMKFFEMPASAANHLNVEGGLCKHSLNVYDEAMGLREVQERLCPGISRRLPVESIAIAALLHDVCKTDLYRKVDRQAKDIDGTWKRFDAFEYKEDAFPVGHGEKFVIMLLQWGLDMTDEEILAIRWHMGAWNLPLQSVESTKQFNLACRVPLVPLIQNADNLATRIIE